MLASVRGARIMIEANSSRARRISAFCDGGKGGAEGVTVLMRRRLKARMKRIGRIVKVYRKESKQTIKPKNIIYSTIMRKAKSNTAWGRTFSIAGGMLRKLLTRSHLSS